MSTERDDPIEEQEQELYEDVPPRSIFAATWFRVVLVVIVLGVIGAVAVPYVLDWMNPPPPPRTAAARPTMADAPLPSAVFDKPLTDKPAGEGTLIPAPSAASPRSAEAQTDPRPTMTPAPPPAPAPAGAAATETKTSKPATAPATPAAKASQAKAAEPKSRATAPRPAEVRTAAVPEGAAKPPAASAPKAAAMAKPAAKPPAASGPFWVQVGAFKDPETARRLVGKLREANFNVEQSVTRTSAAAAATPTAGKTPAPAAGADQYDVFVSGLSVEELSKRLTGKGLTAEAASDGGGVVKPSLPLRDAVTLSKELAVAGFKVQVRRAAGSGPTVTPPAPAAAPASAGGGPELHRVRVGAFPDRAAALAAARELQAKGYKPFIARGDQ